MATPTTAAAPSLTIGAVAQSLGLRTSAVRYYERIGLIPRPMLINGQRRYDPSILPLLQLIQVGQQAGFSLSELHTLVHGFDPMTPPSDRWQDLAHTKLAEIRARMQQLAAMEHMLLGALACTCPTVTACAGDGTALCGVSAPAAVLLDGRLPNIPLRTDSATGHPQEHGPGPRRSDHCCSPIAPGERPAVVGNAQRRDD
ncbi:MAG TPA: MerR family DNA-binding protein [Herpetosiphonaceae bacterium]